jgi:hypothetical protein
MRDVIGMYHYTFEASKDSATVKVITVTAENDDQAEVQAQKHTPDGCELELTEAEPADY